MKNYFITWFYSEQANDESYYPSVGGSSSSAEFQYVYWRCVYVFYRTALATNRDVVTDWIFFTNVENLPTVDGVDFRKFFAENGIKVVYKELTRKTPKDWFGAWRNQFYLFDVLEYFKKAQPGNLLILDSDCVITGSLAGLYQDISAKGVVAMPVGYADDHNINGCSIEEMRAIYQKFFGKTDVTGLTYWGGEIIALSTEILPALFEAFEDIWQKNRLLYEKKETKLNEEAHTLSLCYYRIGKYNDDGRKYTKRMWTDLKCDTVEKADQALPIWHLPAEKKWGFQTMFSKLRGKTSLDAKEAKKMAGRIMGVGASRTYRKLRWYYRYGMKKLQRMGKKHE